MALNTAYPVIVSIATIPDRIGKMRPTLESLIRGDLKPDRIYVNFPRYCLLRRSGYEIPQFLVDPAFIGETIIINQIEKDWGPGTKLLGPLSQLPAPCYLVIADDDIVYHPSFLRGLIEAQQDNHDHSYSYYTYRTGGMPVGQGCDGLSIWSPHLDGALSFAERFVDGTALLYHDDIWINFFLATKGVTARQVPIPPGAELVYEQVLPNDVLSSLDGDKDRVRITREHLPRLFASGLLDRKLEQSFRRQQVLDKVSNFAKRLARKLI